MKTLKPILLAACLAAPLLTAACAAPDAGYHQWPDRAVTATPAVGGPVSVSNSAQGGD